MFDKNKVRVNTNMHSLSPICPFCICL